VIFFDWVRCRFFTSLCIEKCERLIEKVHQMSEVLDHLTAQVARVESVNQSAVTLLQGLHTALIEALAKQGSGEDPQAVQALADRLAADTDALAAAVAANTEAPPAEPPTEPVPAE
jgi:hypothetical protein